MEDYYEEKEKRSEKSYKVCFWSFIVVFIMSMCLAFCSCSTKSLVETETQYHHLTELTERMDSMFRSTSTWQQSIFEKQTALVDSFKQKEVRDTSRVVFLNEKRDTIKEVITIKETIEREHSSQESTQEYYQELFKQTDSLRASNKVLEQKMDSLLHDHNKETMVEKKAPWYQRLWDYLEKILLVILVILLIIDSLRRKAL